MKVIKLSYIAFLHQTTTGHRLQLQSRGCHISLFYIKPQPVCRHSNSHRCCHISLFYIKPQPRAVGRRKVAVVIYRFSTSNHNCHNIRKLDGQVVIYRFSTSNHNAFLRFFWLWLVVIYRFSTSNHNVYHISLWYSMEWGFIFLHEVADSDDTGHKYIRKIPIAMASDAFFLQCFPRY